MYGIDEQTLQNVLTMLEPVRILFSEGVIIFLQSYGNPVVDIIFEAITTVGSQSMYFVLASLTFWCFSRKTGIRVMYVIFFSAFVTIFAKNSFSMPRPPAYLHKVDADGFGFPSGHALITTGFWGYLMFTIKNKTFIFLGLSAILLISLSRVYLGVHYIGDVVGGIFSGIFIAVIIFRIEPWVTGIWRSHEMRSRYFFVLLVPSLLTFAGSFLLSPSLEYYEAGFAMAGIGVGFILEQEKIRFEDVKSKNLKIQRAIEGVLTLGIFWEIMSLIPVFSLFRYAVLGFASTFVAPWVFSWVEKRKPFEK
jgi:membrane-associated phospholipid phosphatase